MSDLPHGWSNATIEQLAGAEGLTTDGDWIETKDQDPQGDVRLIQLADIGDGEFRDRSSRFVTSQTVRRLNCTLLEEGDLLIARMPDPLGRACIFPGVGQPAITAVDVFVWRPSPDGPAARWLMHSVNSRDIRARMVEQAGGTTRQRIAGGRVKQLDIPVPPLPEQGRIVAKIDSLSAKSKRARDQLEHVPRLVEKYKQAILAAAFSGELTKEWRETHSASRPVFGSEAIDQRAGELSEIPASWCWTAIRDVAAVTGGLTKNAKRTQLPRQVPYLRVANVYANELRLEDIANIGCTDRAFEKTRLQRGDLLIVEGNGSIEQIGRVALWNEKIAGCSHQNHIIRARSGPNLLPPYALYWLLSPEGRRTIEAVASSSSGLHTLSISKVEGLPIPICAPDEQQEIIRKVETALSWIERLAKEATSARKLIDHLDQAILAKAFRGELVPQDPADEPASVLLERIRAERQAAPATRRSVRGGAQSPTAKPKRGRRRPGIAGAR
ncbi:MAG: restriction endonuclease subunit S [Hyphomicrobiales bacterium]|nr:restriction endonuclease subunit S [Hyphomicrobiales bacterium]